MIVPVTYFVYDMLVKLKWEMIVWYMQISRPTQYQLIYTNNVNFSGTEAMRIRKSHSCWWPGDTRKKLGQQQLWF